MASTGAATMLFAHGSEPAADQLTKTTDSMNSVIIYFTHTGNTELAAKELSKATGAKAIRLMPKQPYSSADVDWTNETSRCTREHLDQSPRPAITPIDIDFTKVDTIFLGFPIWWHDCNRSYGIHCTTLR